MSKLERLLNDAQIRSEKRRMSMNGINVEMPGLANPCTDLLEKLLVEAKAGRITSLGAVFTNSAGATSGAYAGGQRGDLYVGSAILQRQLLDDMTRPQQRSSIVRATVGG
jgi:hypothetical protein